jgi:hypothetical protein
MIGRDYRRSLPRAPLGGGRRTGDQGSTLCVWMAGAPCGPLAVIGPQGVVPVFVPPEGQAPITSKDYAKPQFSLPRLHLKFDVFSAPAAGWARVPSDCDPTLLATTMPYATQASRIVIGDGLRQYGDRRNL